MPLVGVGPEALPLARSRLPLNRKGTHRLIPYRNLAAGRTTGPSRPIIGARLQGEILGLYHAMGSRIVPFARATLTAIGRHCKTHPLLASIDMPGEQEEG